MKRPAGLYLPYLFQLLIAANVLIGSIGVAFAGNHYLSRSSKEEITGRMVVPKGSGAPGEPVDHEEPRAG